MEVAHPYSDTADSLFAAIIFKLLVDLEPGILISLINIILSNLTRPTAIDCVSYISLASRIFLLEFMIETGAIWASKRSLLILQRLKAKKNLKS
jgi:hypothetical protein